MERKLLYKSITQRILDKGWRLYKSLPSVELMFEQYPVTRVMGLAGDENIMRTVFTLELKADISSVDEERRKAFIDLTMDAAKQLYAQAAMIAAKSPTITLNEVGAQGKVNHPIFDEMDTLKE